jgi:predicted O-linked N-acetylglucosamine transferase (SPINDLY family)
VLEIQSHEVRATALSVMTQAALGAPIDATTLADAARSNARWPLKLLSAVCAQVLAADGRRDYADAIPPLLTAAAGAPVTAGQEDALRVIGLSLANAGAIGDAEAFAERYAACCLAFCPPAKPTMWPLRTAGTALRVGLLVTPAQRGLANTIVESAGQRLGDRCRCTVFVAGAKVTAEDFAALDARVLPADVDVATRGVASLDLDVLVDVAGLRAASGALLARRPARETWGIRLGAVPVAARVTQRIFEGDSEGLSSVIAALDALQVDVSRRPATGVSASDLTTLWEEAVRAHQQGDLASARVEYAKVLALQPDSVAALYLSGLLARADNDVDAARGRLHDAIRAAPSFVDARAALADLELASGRIGEAAQVARDGLEQAPDAAVLWRALGQAELARGEAPAAADAFAEALKRDPTHGETHYNHGVALQMARNTAEAARAYQRALAFNPELHAADFNLGVIFDQQGNADAAIVAFSNVLARAPAHVAAYKALAETLLASGRIDAWFANFEQFERHCPTHIALAAHALEVCAYRADFKRLGRYLDGLRNERFSDGDPAEVLDALQQLLYLLHFFDVEPALIGRLGRTHDALARRIYGAPGPARSTRRPGKLRIGYLSGDFRNHVMGKMMWEALRHHDRDRLELIGYTTSDVRDEWTQRYESIFTNLEPLGARNDRAAAQRIADDDIDVLVDLSTHTKGARPGILALKPARVQVTHVASAGTLALSAIDFKLTDRYADIAPDPESQIEPLLAMEGCVYPYRHVAPAAEGTYTRARAGIPAHAVVIGAFFTPLKLSQRCLALWREILARVPGALLAFSPVHPALRAVYERICAAGGIDPRRTAFLPQGRDDAENQARYRLVDFVLDPMPYGGVNGTLEALDMGVPVVTLVGGRHAERTSYSILMNLGVPDTIAQTGADYVETAVRLATDAAWMKAVRSRIRAALSHSTLTDMPSHTRNLEQAYLVALERCASWVLADAGTAAHHR